MSNDSKVTTLEAPVAAAAPARILKPSPPIAGSGHDARLSGKTTDLMIYANEGEHGSNAVELGLNGVVYLIPRGAFFPVPDEVVDILRNAVTSVTSAAKSGGGVVTRDVPRYNFQTR